MAKKSEKKATFDVEASSASLSNLLSITMQMGLHGGRAQPFMLEGPPGIGKTMGVEAIAKALAEKMGEAFPAEIHSGPQIQAEDAAGLPVPDLKSGTTRLLPLRIGDKVIPAKRGVVCIDEFGSISPAQEAAFLNLLQGGRLGERVLPSSIALGAMMNPEDCASNARGLSAPAANRFTWFSWNLDNNTWIDYMNGGKGFGSHVSVLKPTWEKEYGPRCRALVASYIQRFSSALLDPPKSHDASKAWASPRSWEAVSRFMAALMSLGYRKEDDLVGLAVEGCIGATQAEPFMHWLTDMDLPDPEEILAALMEGNEAKAKAMLPEKRNDQLTVTIEALAIAACRYEHEKWPERWQAAWDVIGPLFISKPDTCMQAMFKMTSKLPKDVKMPKYMDDVRGVLKKAGMYQGNI